MLTNLFLAALPFVVNTCYKKKQALVRLFSMLVGDVCGAQLQG